MDAVYSQEFSKIWSQIVARCWKDDIFKQRAIENPAEALKEFGYNPNPMPKFKIIEEKTSETCVHLVLPKKPASKELVEQELKMISAGISVC